MAGPIKARFCFPGGVEWGSYVSLTCDTHLAIQSRQGARTARGPGGKGVRYGGAPGFTALYRTGRADDTPLYELATTYGGLGKLLWRVLGYDCPYSEVTPPAEPGGGAAGALPPAHGRGESGVSPWAKFTR